MKSDNATGLRTCPRCGAQYGGVPALSRKYPNTQICPDCGTREALESIGVSADEQEKIISIIHNKLRLFTNHLRRKKHDKRTCDNSTFR